MWYGAIQYGTVYQVLDKTGLQERFDAIFFSRTWFLCDSRVYIVYPSSMTKTQYRTFDWVLDKTGLQAKGPFSSLVHAHNCVVTQPNGVCHRGFAMFLIDH